MPQNGEHVGKGNWYRSVTRDDTIETRNRSKKKVVTNGKCLTNLGVGSDEFGHAIIFEMENGIGKAGDFTE